MPLALTFLRVDVKKVQRRVFAALLQKAAGIITMSGERSGELSPALQVRFKVGQRAEVHSDAAAPVNIDDSSDMTPQVLGDQPTGKKVESFLFVSRQRVIGGLVAFMTIEPAELPGVWLSAFLWNLGPSARLFINRDRHALRRRDPTLERAARVV